MTEQITTSLVKKLIEKQFPKWAFLPIKAVKSGGIDNRTFHLGDEMLVRLPSSNRYAEQAIKEQKWLPKLASNLSVQIPEIIKKGSPSSDYPWHWSILKWIEGESANTLAINARYLQQIAVDLARFINEFQRIDIRGAPVSGLHNFYRGSHPSAYDRDTRSYIENLSHLVDPKRAIAVWERAINTKWNREPVWIHGDVASGNILIKDNKLTAVIDFGCMGIGDPACDLVIAWTFFKKKSREVFKESMALDEDTWSRARGWALWKACFELLLLEDNKNLEATKQLEIIHTIFSEHEGL